MAGHSNSVANLATRIAGSSDLYQSSARTPCNSVNFITSHDGFTLYDLVSYEQKQNERNGEENRDGDNHNISWNSGVEGISNNSAIETIRHRRIRSFALLLILSQGVPMITAGDEFGRTQSGNNNSWCQDNTDNWINWGLAKKNNDLLQFFKKCIALRKKHSIFRRRSFFEQIHTSEITWQSLQPEAEDWSDNCHTLAFLLKGNDQEPDFFIMLNGQRAGSVTFTVPQALGKGKIWKQIIDTAENEQNTFSAANNKLSQQQGKTVEVKAMATVVLQSRKE